MSEGRNAESAREWADWLENNAGQGHSCVWHLLRAEADRLEIVGKTVGQVLAEASGCRWSDLSQHAMDMYADRAAAVAAHVVGPNRTVVDRELARKAADALAAGGFASEALRLREALS